MCFFVFVEEMESHDGKENVAVVDSNMVLDGLSGENGAMFLFQSCNYPLLKICI